MSYKYSDFDIDFSRNEFTGDISMKTESNSIRQSVRNIVMTRRGEKPFNRGFGVGLHDYLFENLSPDLSGGSWDLLSLKSKIMNQIISYEPRVVLSEVLVDDSLIDSNELGIEIVYKILKESDIASSPVDRITISVKKVR